MCKPWNGRIVSLTGATTDYPTMTQAEADGLFHPNCRHAFSLYIPESQEEQWARAAEQFDIMTEDEKKSLISQLAESRRQPYTISKKSGDEIYYDDNKRPIYPPNDGAYWPQRRGKLKAGMLVDRYGREKGRFLSPQRTAFEKRSLDRDTDPNDRHTFKVLKDFEVDVGSILPWFGQPGKGVQFKLLNGRTTEIPEFLQKVEDKADVS